MGKTLESAPTDEERVAFELDRFELTGDDRLELSGRWFGVRGRRFMRPSLTLIRDDGQIRLLAGLEHKPWVPETGEPWHTAFSCDSDLLGTAREVELTVSPDLTVKLPPPGTGRTRGRAAKQHKPLPGPSRPRVASTRAATEPSAPQREIAELRSRVESLTRELHAWRAKFQSELAEAHDAATEAALMRERTIADREQAIAERDRAIAERDRAIAERDAVRTDRDKIRAGHDHALERRDQALAEREAAVAGRMQTESELARLSETRASLKLEHDQAIVRRGAAMALRNARIGTHKPGREGLWLTVAIGVAMLTVVVLIVVITLR